MRWRNSASFGTFTFEICGVSLGGLRVVLILKMLHMISALEKEKKTVSELVDTFFHTINQNVTDSTESTLFL